LFIIQQSGCKNKRCRAIKNPFKKMKGLYYFI